MTNMSMTINPEGKLKTVFKELCSHSIRKHKRQLVFKRATFTPKLFSRS